MNVKMKNICIADNYYYLAIFCLLHICIFNYRWDKHSPGWWLWSLFIIIFFRLLLTSNFTSTHQIFPSVEILSVHFKQEKKTSHSLSYWCFHRCICS